MANGFREIWIGEPIMRSTETYGGGHIFVVVANPLGVTLEDAPRHRDERVWGTNHMSETEESWQKFCHEVGLEEFFFQPTYGLISKVERCVLIVEDYVKTISIALEKLRLSRHNPGFREGQDPHLARLIWLDYWFRWALANCRMPVIYNE
ncbi:MAG: hypothetical protein HY434_00095 [Candidatus Liptonbacteria bacterium]|nr:hypothetical protein [Candidatus Liptonbacteria bacterium]